MNTERLQQLRDHIAALPEERFSYEFFLFDTETEEYIDDDWRGGGTRVAPCHTTGCVAGHCIVKFGLVSNGLEPEAAATKFLGLDSKTSDLLFFEGCGTATRKDALARLDHLIAKGDFLGYEFDQEDGWSVAGAHYMRSNHSVPYGDW